MTEPERPDNVPAEAVWNEAENEWELGELKDGKMVGEWKWWLAPTGHLCCVSQFDDDGNLVSYVRYHPDGTFSRKGTYKNGVEHGTTICQRSHNPTNEFFPPRADETVWRTESVFEDGVIVEERYFLEDGTEVPYYGTSEPPEEEEEEGGIEQVSFDSVEEASKRWIEEGLAFKNDLNAWLDRIYKEGEQPEEPEPTETRQDMAEYVISQIVEFNQRGEYDRLRELFPPSYEPFINYYEELGRSISQLFLLNDGKTAIKVGEYYDEQIVYLIDGEDITEQEEVTSIGASYDREYIAKAYSNRIDIHQGWDGPVVCSLSYPDGYGEDFDEQYEEIDCVEISTGEDFNIVNIEVFPKGNGVVMASRAGIFVITENNFQLIHPDLEMIDKAVDYFREESDYEQFFLDLDYPHAALSPNGKYIAVGSQDSYHIILRKENDRWVETAWIEPRSSYPHRAKFHDNNAHIALSSCHFSRSATTGLDLGFLPEFSASAWDADERLHYIDERFWVYSIAPMEDGYLLGDNNGYIWYMAFNGLKQIWYLHAGSTITSMDISRDKKTLAVGTYAGYVIKFRLDDEKDPHLITDTIADDERRWIFWNGYQPMVW